MAGHELELKKYVLAVPTENRKVALRNYIPLQEATAPERLIAAILRQDKDAILSTIAVADLKSTVDTARHERLAGILLERLSNCQLEDERCQALAGELTPVTIHETAQYARTDLEFSQLIAALNAAGVTSLIFTKGISLSRTLFSRPQFRISTDIDAIVPLSELPVCLKALTDFGYTPIYEAGSNLAPRQLGVGPSESVDQLLLSPAPGFVPASFLVMEKPGHHCPIDLKVDPFERGLAMREIDRFFADALNCSSNGSAFKAPSLIDHLLVELVHYRKEGFTGWRWLVDIDLLARNIDNWQLFVERVRHEQIQSVSWAALTVAVDYLNAPVPEAVLNAIAPAHGPGQRLFALTLSEHFMWNSNGIFGLIGNALFVGDRQRKLAALARCLTPSKDFLLRYYSPSGQASALEYPLLLGLHWLTVILPAGIVRKTIGQVIWKGSPELKAAQTHPRLK